MSKAFERMGKKFGWDADSRVRHADFDVRVHQFENDLDLAIFGRELMAFESRFQTIC